MSERGQASSWSPIMTSNADQTYHGHQRIIFTSDQNVNRNKVTTASGDQTFNSDSNMSLVRTQMPNDDRDLYCENSNMAQGQPSAYSSSSPVVSQYLPDRKKHLSTQKQRKQKNYICSYENCGKSFSQSSHLKCHIRIHTGERPYKCSECPWTFPRIDELSRHMKKHTGKLDFICEICHMAYSRSDYLKRHMKKEHFQPAPEADRQ